MFPSLSIGPRTLLNDCNHSATAIFWRSAIVVPRWKVGFLDPSYSQIAAIRPGRGSSTAVEGRVC